MKKVGAVIVTYKNEQMLKALLEDIYAQHVRPDEIIVIDNSGKCLSAGFAQEKFPHVRVFHSSCNLGSAGGYCEGIKIACEKNDLVWLLDDDVRVPQNSLAKLLEAYESLLSGGAVGAVRSWCTNTCPFDSPKKISSFAWRGTLIPKDVVEKVGLPKKEYFLYADDTEYSLRISSAGYSMYWIPESLVLEQRVNDKRKARLFGISASVYEDKAKLYYAFRNQTSMYLGRKMWFELIRTMLYAGKVILLTLSAGKSGCFSRIKAVFLGLIDGICGRLGLNPAYTPL